MKITKAMQSTHNVNNSGTFIPILCSEIHQSVYFLAVMRSPICGRYGAKSMKRYGVRPSVCLSQHGPQQQTLIAAGRRYRSTAARRTAARRNSVTATLSAYVVTDHRLVTS